MATNRSEHDAERDLTRRTEIAADPARAAIADVQAAVREPDRPLGMGGESGDGARPLGPLTGAAAIDPDEQQRLTAEGPLGAQVPDDEAADARRDR